MIDKKEEERLIIEDLLMLGLVSLNLAFIIFDWLFNAQSFQNIIHTISPDFYKWYATVIHPDFLLYDLIFVAIFLTELLIRWGIAIYRKTYEYWFWYPIIHWYDVVGCIPLGSFRFLRVLRLFSVCYRIQKLGYFDFTKTYPLNIIRKYYSILVEEVSDRVVVNALETVKTEIKSGTPITDEIVTQVIIPNKCELVDWLSGRINTATQQVYNQRKDDVRKYVEHLVNKAMKKNNELNNLSKFVPFGGKIIADMITVATQDIVFNVMNNLVEDLASAENKSVIEELLEVTFEVALIRDEPSTFNEENESVSTKILLDAVSLIQKRVEVQQWKIKAQKERELEEYLIKQKELEETLTQS